MQAMRELHERLGQELEALPADADADQRHLHWRAPPKLPPPLTAAETQRANAAREAIMADIRQHPARRR